MNERDEIVGEDRIFKCPECREEMNHLGYSVTTIENGSADMMVKRITTFEIDPKTKKKKKIITEKIDTCDFESDDNNWNEDPSYECRECGAELYLRDIIIEKPEEEEEKEEIKEPDNAIESDEKELKIRQKTSEKTYMIDMKNMNICVCPECGYTFCADEKYNNLEDEEIIICNKCGNEIEAYKNNQELIKKTLND